MRSLSTLGLALSLVFGCLLLALMAELYYLLWWKNRVCRRDIEDDDCISPSKELFHKFCFEKHLSFSSTALSPQQPRSSTHKHEPQPLFLGPSRFLFTIKEETKEDMEIEEGRSRKKSRSKSLSNVLFSNGETPYLTPLASPPYRGFNSLSELSNKAEFFKMRSSPPPKFKFLRDAEDKLYRKKLMEKAVDESPSTP